MSNRTNTSRITRATRIAGIPGRNRLIPVGSKIPIVNIKPPQYTKLPIIRKLLKQYHSHILAQGIKRKILITGHGHLHPKYNWLPLIENTLLMDINPGCNPDIVGDFNNNNFMSRFPSNWFDSIYVTYTPPPSPISTRNTNMWLNFHRILKKGGEIRCNYILYVLRSKKLDRISSRKKIVDYFSKIFKIVKFDQGFTILIK